MKISALLIIAAVIMLTGSYLNTKLKKRVLSLKRFILLIEGIDSQMIFSKRKILQIIDELTCREENQLKTMKSLVEMGDGDFSENWQKAVEENGSDDALNEEDKRIVLSFGKGLGVTDLDGQNKNCRMHIELLNKQLLIAEKDAKEKLKINTAVSSFLAVAFFIIFY